MTPKSSPASAFERGLFAVRWLMAPMYVGLGLVLGMLVVIFLREVLHHVPQALTMDDEAAIVVALTLIDLTLVGNLLLIVIFSGYESFISKLDVHDDADRPDWMGTVDFSGIKLKLVALIVAISGIHLLKRFMEVGDAEATGGSGFEDLRWLVVVHVAFVVSGVLLALTDRLSAGGKKP